MKALLLAYDGWCMRRVKALLKWLEEWFSISQKQVEVGMIVLYMVLLVGIPLKNKTFFLIGMRVFVAFTVGFAMWILHSRPEAMRQSSENDPGSAVMRVFFQAFFAMIIALDLLLPPCDRGSKMNALAQVVYAVFFYVISINSKGEPGRRRKLALAELKKIFGTEWIPKPAFEPR